MQIGCGVYAHVVRGRRYLYFWHYETAGGRRRQVKEYLGPADLGEVRKDARRRVSEYFAMAAREMDRLRRQTLVDISRGGGPSEPRRRSQRNQP